MVSKNFEILISTIAKSNMLKSTFFLNYINNYFSMSVHIRDYVYFGKETGVHNG